MDIERCQYALPGFEDMLPEPVPIGEVMAKEPVAPSPVAVPVRRDRPILNDGFWQRIKIRLGELFPSFDLSFLKFPLLLIFGVLALATAASLIVYFCHEEGPSPINRIAPEPPLDPETAALKVCFESDWNAARKSGSDLNKVLSDWKPRLLTHQASYEPMMKTREALVGKMVALRRVDELYYCVLVSHDEMLARMFAVNSIAKAAASLGTLRRDLVWVRDGVTYAVVMPHDSPRTLLFVRFAEGKVSSLQKIDDGVVFESEPSDEAPFGRLCDIRLAADSACLYRVSDGKVLAKYPLGCDSPQ